MPSACDEAMVAEAALGPVITSGRVLVKILVGGIVADAPCCTVASVRKCLQASGIDRGRSNVQEYMMAEHGPAKQVK